MASVLQDDLKTQLNSLSSSLGGNLPLDDAIRDGMHSFSVGLLFLQIEQLRAVI